jgi:hypothetical protein
MCFSFYYWMNGFDLSTLNVYLVRGGTIQLSTVFYKRIGNYGRSWNLAKVDLILLGNINYNLELEGISGGLEGVSKNGSNVFFMKKNLI